jgi:two-component system chemotaxis sensor kinase CheA
MESLLERVRGGELAIAAPVTDVLFKAADALERGIEESVAGRAAAVDTREVLSELRRFAAVLAVEAERAPSPAAKAEWSVAAPPGAGKLVRVRLAHDTPLRGVRAFIVVQALRRIGDVASVEPPLDALHADQFGRDFALRLVTTATDGDIERTVRGSGDVAGVRVGEDKTGLPQATASGNGLTREETKAELVEPVRGGAGAAADPRGRSVRIELSRLDSLMDLIGELMITRGRLQELSRKDGGAELAETVTQASRLIGDLRDEIITSRMVPVWQVFDRFPRLVRDASHSLGKQIDFTVEGKDIELDRSMLDEVGEPIVHLLRNAIDHGIETPDERIAAGKPAAGRLLLSAARDRNAVVIRVSDDGKGIDRERVLAKAKHAGLIDPSRVELSDAELIRIIAKPGFSTAEQVTGLSGRGVGVDAVTTRVRLLGGNVDLRSVRGRGTTVTLRLPLTLAIVRALLARVENEQYAIPTTHVRETIELQPHAVTMLRGREVLLHREDVLPLIRLRSVVGLPAANLPELEQAVIVELADKRAALVVDDLIGQQDIVVKQVDQVRNGLRCFSGATILSNGAPALILDVGSLS